MIAINPCELHFKKQLEGFLTGTIVGIASVTRWVHEITSLSTILLNTSSAQSRSLNFAYIHIYYSIVYELVTQKSSFNNQWTDFAFSISILEARQFRTEGYVKSSISIFFTHFLRQRRASSSNPCFTHPTIMESQETTSTSMASNTLLALFKSPHCAYMSTNALQTNTLVPKPPLVMQPCTCNPNPRAETAAQAANPFCSHVLKTLDCFV
ncbi:unnamed protein product [Ilex paraguariensis]|uniref:Uncharacterized protein n=1 Tax=Ilex paraguariensis TaxID=185542 RepID=A0ABC8SQZ8_9AQUA